MNKAKILKDYDGVIKPLNVQNIDELKIKEDNIDILLFFKHKSDCKWLKKVIKRARISKDSNITTDEVRRLLIEAVKLKIEGEG